MLPFLRFTWLSPNPNLAKKGFTWLLFHLISSSFIIFVLLKVWKGADICVRGVLVCVCGKTEKEREWACICVMKCFFVFSEFWVWVWEWVLGGCELFLGSYVGVCVSLCEIFGGWEFFVTVFEIRGSFYLLTQFDSQERVFSFEQSFTKFLTLSLKCECF